MRPLYMSRIMESLGNNPFLGITVINQHGIVVFRNSGMEKISGIKCNNSIGKHFKDVSSDSTLIDVLQTGEPRMGCLYRTPEGKHAIIHRIPLWVGHQLMGAMSIAVFDEASRLQEILEKCYLLEGKVKHLEQELCNLKSAQYDFSYITGENKIIREVKELAKSYAGKNANILITGESGTGKEIFSHAIHNASRRNKGPFIRLNCSCFPRELLESELFGYEGGAFSGSRREGKPGKFELADNGTIFLDEIGDLPLDIQPKLLRVIEDKIVERVGGIKPRYIDFRLIAATNKDLNDMVKRKLFRDDLYFRLSVLTLHIPPLRERREDIPLISQSLMATLNDELGTNFKLDPMCLEIFKKHDWPGNIRELRNILERTTNVVQGNIIQPSHFPPHFGIKPPSKNESMKKNILFRQTIYQSEKDLLDMALKTTGGNKAKASKFLGISRTSLYKKLNKHGTIKKDPS